MSEELRFAVNLADLTELKQRSAVAATVYVRQLFTDSPDHVNVGSGIDDVALVIDGEAAESPQRLIANVELLSGTLGKAKIGRPIRCYREGARGGWAKVTKRELAKLKKSR